MRNKQDIKHQEIGKLFRQNRSENVRNDIGTFLKDRLKNEGLKEGQPTMIRTKESNISVGMAIYLKKNAQQLVRQALEEHVNKGRSLGRLLQDGKVV